MKTENFNLEFFLSDAGYKKVSLTKLATGHLIFYGKINRTEGRFILDTGAGISVIEEQSSEKFNLKAVMSDCKATGVGSGEIHVYKSEANQLNIDGYHIENLILMVINLEHVNNRLESAGIEKVDGVLGSDVLTRAKAIIDYAQTCLYLL